MEIKRNRIVFVGSSFAVRDRFDMATARSVRFEGFKTAPPIGAPATASMGDFLRNPIPLRSSLPPSASYAVLVKVIPISASSRMERKLIRLSRLS